MIPHSSFPAFFGTHLKIALQWILLDRIRHKIKRKKLADGRLEYFLVVLSLTIEHRGKAIRRLMFVRELAGSRRSVSRSNLLSSEVSASYQKETKWLTIEAHPAY